jgi:hypothetical protein
VLPPSSVLLMYLLSLLGTSCAMCSGLINF